jgi:hypothetical protein
MPAQKMPVEYGEWRPDVALLDTKFAADVENVFAGVNSYLPFPSLLPWSLHALPDPPARGLYSARTSTGEWKIYAGSATKLYRYSATGWVDISRFTTTPGDHPYNLQPGHMWQFQQSGGHIVAVNVNDDPQWAVIDTGAAFEALPGSPPRATNVRQMGDFLFLSGLAEPDNMQIIWSGINDITQWSIGVSLCDLQEFPDGGPVMGVAGAEIGYVVQERAIRTLQFLPGDTTFIFNFTRVLHDRGSVSLYGFNSIGNVLYFVSEDGFYSLTGQQVTPVGQDKVNQWWLDNSDISRRNVVHCIIPVNKPRVVWVYHAFSGSPRYDRQIIFDWSNGRWARASIEADVWAMLASLGIDLDTDDAGDLPSDIYLDPPLSTSPSLDSFAYQGGRPVVGAIDSNGRLGTLTGPNLQATLETAEVHLAPGGRAFVSDVYVIDDAGDGTGTIAAGTRERLGDLPVFQAAATIEITGSAASYTSSRLHRFRRIIPAATVWTHAEGVVVEAQQDGSVA